MRKLVVAVAVAWFLGNPAAAAAQLEPVGPVIETITETLDELLQSPIERLPNPIKSPVKDTKDTVDKTVRDVIESTPSPQPTPKPEPEPEPSPTPEPDPEPEPRETPGEPPVSGNERPQESDTDRDDPFEVPPQIPEGEIDSAPPPIQPFVPEPPPDRRQEIANPRVAPPATGRGGPGFTILEPENPSDIRLWVLGAVLGVLAGAIIMWAGKKKAEHEDRKELTALLNDVRNRH